VKAKIKNSRRIFVKNNLNLQPILKEVEVKNIDEIYKYIFFVGVDRNAYEIEKIDKITVEITPKLSVKDMKTPNLGNTFFRKKSKNSGSLINKIIKGNQIKSYEVIQNKINRNKNKKPITTSINDLVNPFKLKSFANFGKNNDEKFGTERTFITKRIPGKKIDNTDVVIKGRDSKEAKKNSKRKTKTGLRIQNQILLNVKKDRIFKKEPVQVNKKNISVPIHVEISKRELIRLKSSGINFVANFTAKNKRGVAIDSTSQKIPHNFLLSILKFDTHIDQFSMTVNRSFIYLDSKSKNKNINCKLHFKKYNPFEKNTSIYEKKIENLSVIHRKPKRIDLNSKNKYGFPLADVKNVYNTIYTRMTYQIDGFDIDNFIEDSIPPKNFHDDKYVPFYVSSETEVDTGRLYNRIIVPGQYIEADTTSISLLKRTSRDDSFDSINFQYEKDSKTNERLTQRIILGKSVAFLDYNVKDDYCYEYKLEIKYDNRISQIVSNGFKIIPQEREEIVSIKKISTSASEIKLHVTIKENDAEKIFKRLFGNIFSLFEEDIKKIKKLNANAISIKVEKINVETGEEHRDHNYDVDENGNVSIPLIGDNSKFIFKIIPFVKSISEAITAVKSKLKNDILIDRPKTSNKNLARFFERIKNTDKKIVSTLGNKYINKKASKRSMLTSEREVKNETIFEDGNTGDIIYIDDYVLAENLNQNEIKKAVYTLLPGKKLIDVSYEFDFNDKEKDLYLIEISGNYAQLSDHILVVYDQNGTLYNAGRGHIDHQKQRHNILVKCDRGIGEKKFYFYIINAYGTPGKKYSIGRK
jgi:hypothetical protein